MILDECQQLNQKIDRYEEIQRQRDHAETLEQRRKELEEERAVLRQSVQSVKVLVEAQLLDRADLPSATKVNTSLGEVRRLFREDALQITKGDDYQTFLTEIASVRERIDEVCRRIWEEFTVEVTPVVDHALLRAREDIPEFESLVEKIRVLDEELELAAEEIPSTAEELSSYRESAQLLREEHDKLMSGEYPPEVIEFLRAANTPKGASLSLLTSPVLDWLEESGKIDEFSIKTST